MKVSRRRIATVIADTTLKSGINKKFAREIGAYLMSEHRTAELESLIRDVQDIWAEDGTVDVIAVSAHPITAKISRDIVKEVRKVYPYAKHVIITPELDSSIKGGVKLEFANQQLDMSIENKLNQFKQLTAAGKD